jgi:hypothetical protein
MMDQDMKRRPLDRNSRSLEPDTQFSENIVNETLIARTVSQPVHNVAVRMRGGGIDFCRRVHFLLLSRDLVDGTGYVVSRVDGVNGGRRAPVAASTVGEFPRADAGGRGSRAASLSTKTIGYLQAILPIS